ncbi:MAG: peptidase MA family metallohydrolase [Dehalococcoidia bacterium]
MAAGLLLAFAVVGRVTAEVEAVSATASSTDPSAIEFSVQVSGDPIASATLSYRRASGSTSIGGDLPGEVPSRGIGTVTARLSTNGTNAYIPVGTRFTYHWILRTEGGDTIETDPEEFTFLDGRFPWQELEEGGVTVYWYADETLARSVMTASASAVADMSDLLNIEIDFPITVVLYAGGDDGLAAQQPRGGVYDELSRTGGTRVAPDIVHVYDSLGLGWEDITRHEITHVVTSEAGDGAFTSIPSWLDEGLATYAQAQKGGRVAAVDAAIATDNTLRLRNLAAPVNRADQIELFYGQSWRVVEYLIDAYGEDAMADLLATIKAGSTTDQALEEVYGLDQDSLYNEWRVSVGLDPIEFAPVAQATTTAPAEATRAPLTLPTSVTGSSSSSGATSGGASGDDASGEAVDGAEEGGSNRNVVTAAIIGAVTLVLAGGLGFFGVRLLRAKP